MPRARTGEPNDNAQISGNFMMRSIAEFQEFFSESTVFFWKFHAERNHGFKLESFIIWFVWKGFQLPNLQKIQAKSTPSTKTISIYQVFRPSCLLGVSQATSWCFTFNFQPSKLSSNMVWITSPELWITKHQTGWTKFILPLAGSCETYHLSETPETGDWAPGSPETVLNFTIVSYTYNIKAFFYSEASNLQRIWVPGCFLQLNIRTCCTLSCFFEELVEWRHSFLWNLFFSTLAGWKLCLLSITRCETLSP